MADSPLLVGFVSMMLDVPLGEALTLGSMFASEKYICPNAIGVSIGCAMHAMLMVGLHKDDLPLQQKNKCSPF